MEHLIQINNLTFEYEAGDGAGFKALDGVHLTVARGSFIAVIGRNGSGKSTLAKNLNGLLLPTGGEVLVKGWSTKDEARTWDIRQAAGIVFQNPDNQLVASVVEDDVAFGPENLGIAPEEIRQRVDKALKAVNMYEERKKAPHLLSGGQKQRIAIAGVLAMEPEILILDEPTAMLDPQGRKELMETICFLNKERGITIVLITHFMEEAALADRILIMDRGKIAMDGSPDKIFTRTQELKALGMELPFAVEMAYRLREKGLDLPAGISNMEELVEQLCR